jgi:hypothetical protein
LAIGPALEDGREQPVSIDKKVKGKWNGLGEDGAEDGERACARLEGVVVVCQRRGGNTENNNGVKLHKYQIWISVGESVTSLPAGRTTWCAFSPQTGVDITERTQKKKERASR